MCEFHNWNLFDCIVIYYIWLLLCEIVKFKKIPALLSMKYMTIYMGVIQSQWVNHIVGFFPQYSTKYQGNNHRFNWSLWFQAVQPHPTLCVFILTGGSLGLACGTGNDDSPSTEGSTVEGRVGLMPEYLVVCCWRTTKEVSLLLGQTAVQAPVITPGEEEEAEGLISYQQVTNERLRQEAGAREITRIVRKLVYMYLGL